MHHAHLYIFTALHATIRVSEGFSRSAVLKKTESPEKGRFLNILNLVFRLYSNYSRNLNHNYIIPK